MEAKTASKTDTWGHSLPNSLEEMRLLRTTEIQIPDEVMQLPRPISSLSLKSNAHRCLLWKRTIYFFGLIYLWYLHTLILYKHPHVQTCIHLVSMFVQSISYLGARPFVPYSASFVVTWKLPLLLVETFMLLYSAPGEKQHGKPHEKWSSKLLTASTRGECEVCRVAVPWSSTCFPSTSPCIHKYPWHHLRD